MMDWITWTPSISMVGVLEWIGILLLLGVGVLLFAIVRRPSLLMVPFSWFAPRVVLAAQQEAQNRAAAAAAATPPSLTPRDPAVPPNQPPVNRQTEVIPEKTPSTSWSILKKLFWVGVVLGAVLVYFAFREELTDSTSEPWVWIVLICIGLLILLHGWTRLMQRLSGTRTPPARREVTQTTGTNQVTPATDTSTVIRTAPEASATSKAPPKTNFWKGFAVVAAVFLGIVIWRAIPPYAVLVGAETGPTRTIDGYTGDTPEDAARRRTASTTTKPTGDNPRTGTTPQPTLKDSFELVLLERPKDPHAGWPLVVGKCVLPESGTVRVILKERHDAFPKPERLIHSTDDLRTVAQLGIAQRNYLPPDGVSKIQLRRYGGPGCA